MTKTQKGILIALPIVLGVGFLIWYLRKGKNAGIGIEKTPADPTTDVTVIPNANGGYKPIVQQYFPLKKGSKGEKVKELQRALIAVDPGALPKYGVDGDFGSETEAAVQKYLGKKSVDSQEDLNKILAVKATQAAQALENAANANRSKLAGVLVNAYKANPANLDFYAIWDTQVNMGTVTSDGRQVGGTTVVKTTGQKLPLTRNAKFTISSNGFIQAVDGNNFYYFSPYGFEVK